jgi:hypothetical protein
MMLDDVERPQNPRPESGRGSWDARQIDLQRCSGESREGEDSMQGGSHLHLLLTRLRMDRG